MEDYTRGQYKHTDHGAHGHGHAHLLQNFKRRFLISLLLTIPVMLLSEMIQMWFNFILIIPYQGAVLLLLSVFIYFYGGWPFLKGMVQEVRSRQPGMMTLIGMAISVAFFFTRRLLSLSTWERTSSGN